MTTATSKQTEVREDRSATSAHVFQRTMTEEAGCPAAILTTAAKLADSAEERLESMGVGLPALPVFPAGIPDGSKTSERVILHSAGPEDGLNAGKESVEAVQDVLAALCRCVTATIRRGASCEAIYFQDIEVHTHATLDPRALLHAPMSGQAMPFVQTIHMDIVVRGAVSPQQCRRIAEMARRSPVHALLSSSATVFTTVMSG